MGCVGFGGVEHVRLAGGVGGEGGSEDPHEIFRVYDPKRCILKAFFSIFI